MKNSLKLILVSLILFLFSCQQYDTIELIEEYPDNSQMSEEPKTHSQFFSRDLFTLKWNKKKVKVALFLPFSGKHQELGWHLFNSATLSLFENDSKHAIELVLIDSKTTARETRKAFQKIIDQDIKIVIGPVFSNKIDIIKEDAKKHNITVISLSNNREIAENFEEESNIFLAGLMPETEIDKITSYMMEKGKLNFVIIAPKTKYGSTVSTVMRHMIRIKEGNFMTSQFYEKNGRNIEKAVERAINSFIIPQELLDKTKEDEEFTLTENDRIYAQVIMIPESGRNLKRVVKKIKELNTQEREFQIIGTSQWDSPSTINIKELEGAYFAAPNNKKFKNFERLYQQSYGNLPPRISSIVYDSIIAAIEVSLENDRQNPTPQHFIQMQDGFRGIDGPFRFLPNGLVERNISVLKIENSEFEVEEKASGGFLDY